MRLKNQVAVVTGASSGIGRGIATRFAEEGATVVVSDIRETPKPAKHVDREDERATQKVIQDIGGEVRFVEADVGEAADCKKVIEETIDAYDQLDILVNNAGIHIPGNIEELAIEDWQRVIDVNLSGVFYCTKYALPHLRDTEGSIINIGSVHSKQGGSGPGYAASKAGIANLTRDLATEYGDEGIRVNALCPGAVRTSNWNYLDEEDIQEAHDQTLLPRLGESEDIADAAAFLASGEADWITGEMLYVDGGWSAHR